MLESISQFKNISEVVFSMFLFAAAWQDGKTKSVSLWLLGAAGMAGLSLSLLHGTLGPARLLSCLPGGGLLLLSRFTNESVGMGDGLFFVVSGLFLNVFMNLELLIYGIFLNGAVCGAIYFYNRMAGRDVRKKTIPFLPFLVPVWIGMVML